MAETYLSNAALASKVDTLVQRWSVREDQYKAWIGGAADGGPNGDGRFPLTDDEGVTHLVESPAKLADTVMDPAGAVQETYAATLIARDAASTSSQSAAQDAALASASKDAAVEARELSLLYRNEAAADKAAVAYHREVVEGIVGDFPTAMESVRDRSTHTGEQPISSVAGLQDALSGKASVEDVAVKVDAAGARSAAVGISTSQAPSRAALAAAEGVFLVGNAVQYRANRSDLAAQTNTAIPAFLTETGRRGQFIWSTSNLTAAVASDPQQGLYIPPASDPTGASGAWVRVWDGVTGKAEWFGAIAGGPDCSLAINAAIQLCAVTQLEPTDYWITNTVKVNKTGRKLKGAGQHYVSATGDCTRILTSSATLQPVQVGADSFPGSVNNYIRGMALEDVYVGRTTGPNISSAVAGVLVQYCLGAEVSRVKSLDSIHSFRFNGTVACYIRNTNANRVVAGTGGGTDTWTGYWLDGSASIGLAGGNASLYLIETQAGCNLSALQTGSSYGYRLTSGFQDAFLEKPESVSCNVGIAIEGGTAGNADVQITHPIMDAVFKWGIYVNGLLASGSVQITDPYVGHNSSTQFGVYINNSVGTISIDGGQLLGGSFSGQGVAIIGSKGVSIDGFLLKDVAGTGLGTGGTCSNLKLRTIHHNPAATGGAAVQLNGTAANACVVEPLVYGKASAFTFGVQVVGAIDARNEYNMSGIDSGCIAGGSGNKLVRNGVQITATGLTGNNLASGVMT